MQPRDIHDLVMQKEGEPVVFHGMLEDWGAMKWTPHHLADILGTKDIRMKIGPRDLENKGKGK